LPIETESKHTSNHEQTKKTKTKNHKPRTKKWKKPRTKNPHKILALTREEPPLKEKTT
jgi:hypothetical protein